MIPLTTTPPSAGGPYPLPSASAWYGVSPYLTDQLGMTITGCCTIDHASEPGEWQRAIDRGCLAGLVGEHGGHGSAVATGDDACPVPFRHSPTRDIHQGPQG